MRSDRLARPWMRLAERILFLVAAIALGWYSGVRVAAMHEQTALSNELERARTTLRAASATARRAAPRPLPAPRALIGRIDVPRLRLSALAREGVDTATLRGSAGHVPGSALPGENGNAAFAAHRDTFFRPLQGIHAGDEVTIATPSGDFRYLVSSTRVVDPSDVSVLRASDAATLTLVTCYPFDFIGSAPRRFIVSAVLAPSELQPR